MAERTSKDRRTHTPVSLGEKDPRHEDRRDSPRLPMRFLVRDTAATEGAWEEREGDLGVGGIHWKGKTAALGTFVDVRFRIPGVPRELRARGEIIRISGGGKDLGFHVRFTDLDVQSELAIARHLDAATRASK